MTESIIALARPESCTIYGIDPTVETHPSYENYVLIQKPSHEGLHDVPACDVYFVDGDHNYYTVKGELERIKETPSSDPMFPLVFLHDVGWPQDRRDSYYLPSHVPAGSRRKSDSGLGVDPTLPGLSEFGLAAGNPGYVFANDRGGAENGVLTAVEDFVRENSGWGYLTVPGVFGLGIVYKLGGNGDLARKIAEIGTAISWLGEEISILEYNRLQLLCESYRTHHHFSMTTNELSARKSRNADLEREVVEAYQARDASDVRAEELRSRSTDLEREVVEAYQARDASDVRAEELRSRSTDLERGIAEAKRLAEEANVRAEALQSHSDLIMGSWSFKIGRMITFPARRMKLLLK